MKKEGNLIKKRIIKKTLKKANKSFIIPLSFDKGLKLNLKLSIVEIKRLFLNKKWHYVSLSLVSLIIITSSMLMYKNFTAEGATYGWFQTDWSGGASATTATHTNNQENWTQYTSKTANISTVDGVLTQTSASPDTWLETTDTDFTDHGTTTATTYINGGKIYPKKSAGASCLTDSECLGACALNVCDSPTNWLSGPCAGIYVYYIDVSGTKQWKVTQTACDTPQCGINGAQNGDNLVANNTVDFSLYPARNFCKTLGGRLPTPSELSCMYSYRSSYGNNFLSSYYWSSTEYNTSHAWYVNFYDGSSNVNYKDNSGYVRCVRGQ